MTEKKKIGNRPLKTDSKDISAKNKNLDKVQIQAGKSMTNQIQGEKALLFELE